MKLVVDMNLSPDWVSFLAVEQIQAVHWSTVGEPTAPDTAIMTWAKENSCVVFTHDLDFGKLLALTKAQAPSVIQIRSQDTFPEAIGHLLLSALKQFEQELKQGALITINSDKTRVRVLPFNRN